MYLIINQYHWPGRDKIQFCQVLVSTISSVGQANTPLGQCLLSLTLLSIKFLFFLHFYLEQNQCHG